MKYLMVVCLFFIITGISAQNRLQEYLSVGLENNLALKQKESGFRLSLEALKEARSLFYPVVSFNARYTVSQGGRVIEFPVGDMLNPVYATLNQLTASNLFPDIENQEIAFLRPAEHETKIRLVQQVYNSDLHYNAKINKELTLVEEINLEQYKRELVAEIKKAYFSVGMTESLLTLLQETRQLLVENVRVNAKLVENNKVTYDNLLRSQTELSRFEQQLQVAAKDKQLSLAYFNFLLNRPLSDSVLLDPPVELILPADEMTDYAQQAVANREEIKSLQQYGRISELNTHMNRSGSLPDLIVVADYGFQGEKYVFNKDHNYLQASIVLSWDLFKGFQNRTKIRQALIRQEIVEQRLNEARGSVELQVIRALNELKVSEEGIIAAESQVKTAREGFRLVRRRYEEGQTNLIDFLDARITLTQAEENLIISQFTSLVNYAEFEKVTAIRKP